MVVRYGAGAAGRRGRALLVSRQNGRLDSIGHCRFRRGILACIVYLTSGTAMGTSSFSARYTAALAESRGRCPIETGVLGRLADRECQHGRLPYGRTPGAEAGFRTARR